MNILNNNKTYSWIALVSILLGDAFALIARFSYLSIWYYCLIGIFSLLIILWMIGRLKNVRFGFKSIILVKLLSNAAAPHPLSVLYLLLFVLHIGWLGNIFASSDNILLSLSVCVLLIFFIILFFPSRQESKDDNATKVFVSGISAINFNIRNLIPLVRILQKTQNNDSCEMIILYSNYYSKDSNKEWINNNMEKYYNKYYINFYQSLDSDDTKRNYEKIKNCGDIKEKLQLLIRIIAYNEFPEKKWILKPDKFNIIFTSEEVDYDNFQHCFKIVTNYLTEKDDTSHVLYFNLTPGTANVSALMTLMAIDGDRKLFYYIPENDPQKVINMSEKEKELRLTEVQKNELSLDNLLSQAIETLNK